MYLNVGDFASKPVHAINVDSPFLDALRVMSDRCISCVVVVERDEAVGILTERDIVFASNWVLGQPGLRVREVMNKPVLTVPEEMNITKAHQIFKEHGIRHLVVLDHKLDMGGIFTQTDLVRALQEQFFHGVENVSELMSTRVLKVRSDVAARYALSQMARRAVSCVVVVEDDEPVGIFTERDVVRLVAEGVDLDAVTVETVMSSSLVTAAQGITPKAAITLMQKHSIRRLLVMDDLGKLTGILTQTDLGRVLNRSVSASDADQPANSAPEVAADNYQML